MRILIAEDEKDLNRLLKKRLEEHSYSVDACLHGEEALAFLEMTEYDAVILDIMMPKKDGLSVLRELRAKGNKVPVLLLTARSSVDDRVSGLDAGADDYLVKPFAFEELLARIRVMLRKNTAASDNVCRAADLTVCLDSHRVFRGDTEITLSSKEFAVLRYLILNQGIVLSREIQTEHADAALIRVRPNERHRRNLPQAGEKPFG